MLRLAVIAFAAALLGACASVGSHQPGIIANASFASFDDANAAPVEAPLVARPVSDLLERRLFSPPSRRQPDLRLVLVSAADRSRRRARRRARFNAATMSRPASFAA